MKKLIAYNTLHNTSNSMYQNNPLAVTNKQILTGVGVPDNTLGNDGDQYIDTTSDDLYNKALGSWTLVGNLQGPPGDSGSQILTGTGAPSSSLGVDGDYYINNLNGEFYQKIGGLWVSQGMFSGSSILVDGGVPNNSLGSDGDYYIDNLTNDYYLKSSGAWALQGNLEGNPGIPGTPGNEILTGNGPPFFIVGRTGDYYIDVLTGDYYGYVSIAWTLRGNLLGPQGIPGSDGTQILTGSGIPVVVGDEGDYYIDTSTGSYYEYTSGSWILRGSLVGPVGEEGQSGSQIIVGSGAPLNSIGEDSDYYINNVNGDYYRKVGGAWTFVGSLIGPNGSQILVGSGPPPPSIGINGDYYINTLNNDYYVMISGVWNPIGNLTGPQGEQGIQRIIFTEPGPPSPALGLDGQQYLNTETNELYSKQSGVWVLDGVVSGPPGVAGSNTVDPAFFGDGSDGNVNLGNQVTLTRDMYYNNLLLVPGGVIFSNGYRVFVRDLMRFNGGTIIARGSPAVGTAAGLGTPSGTLGGGGNGASGVQSPGTSAFAAFNNGVNFFGGNGGGTGATLGGAALSTPYAITTLRNLSEVSEMRWLEGDPFTGGAGGGRGGPSSTGGGGGGGGGVVFLAVGTVDGQIVGSFDIINNGGNGGDSATGGGGGGGGGGLVVVISGRRLFTVRANVAGGNGGTGATGNGSNGGNGFFQHIFV